MRAKAVSLSTATNWAFNFALAWAVPPGLSNIAWKTYFIFGTFNFAAFIHIFFMYPETVGRSLEEVEEIFKQGHVFTAWKIKKDVGRRTLAEVVERTKEIEASLFHHLVRKLLKCHCSQRRSIPWTTRRQPKCHFMSYFYRFYGYMYFDDFILILCGLSSDIPGDLRPTLIIYCTSFNCTQYRLLELLVAIRAVGISSSESALSLSSPFSTLVSCISNQTVVAVCQQCTLRQ